MTPDQTARAIYLGLLAVAIGGSFIIANRANMGKMIQHAAIWVLIFIGTIGAIGLWQDISDDVTGRQTIAADGTIEVPRSIDGHYYLALDINGVPVEFVVDTGATDIVLTRDDAARIGFDPDALSYSGRASTANGLVSLAPVRLDQVALGPVTDRGVSAVVNQGQMDASLLGMTYLSRFDRFEISGDRLVLAR